MKNIVVRFEREPALSYIDILFRAAEQDSEVRALMERVSDHMSDKLPVLDGNANLHMLALSDIISVSAEGRQARIRTTDGNYDTRQSLQSVESRLDPRRFMRISRYELVNLSKVTCFDFTVVGTLRLEFSDGSETWASRRCIPLMRKRLSGKE